MESGDRMGFKEFWPLCRYLFLGYDGNGGFEPVCIRPGRRPPGLSWEKCREDYCPYFGMKVKAAQILCEGKEIGTAKELTFVMSSRLGERRDKKA